ncbi:alcohol dehydrogenase catalytic domain-containing protein [bacterium]|nr:alcohol dehydrogenase catalytic domain-containing protein [bacterium]
MKAAYLVAREKFDIREIPEPRIENERDVLVKLCSSGVCGSDIHNYKEGRTGSLEVTFPMILGHECSAVVEKVGKAVTKVKPGDRVAIEPAVTCDRCEECLSGRQNLCKDVRFLSVPGGLEGCLKEYMVMPEANVILLPKELTFEDAVVLEPLSVCAYAVNLAQIKPGDSIAVLGSGPIGLLTLEVANTSGAALSFATDIVKERVEMALRLGATHSLNPNETDVVREILDATHGRGVDAVLECAGEQDTVNQGLEVLRAGGKFILIGIPGGATEYVLQTDIWRRKELTVVYVRRQVHYMERALNLVKAGKIDIRSLVTHRFPLEKTNDAYELVSTYKDGVVKAIINI